jgi:exopolysaccharide biosynthesis polyprenyl glycosylphosphotransferase
MDVFCSLIGLIILSPLLLLVAVLVKITSPGPVFYSHERIGRDGKKFRLYKFRSMYQNAEQKVGHFWSVKDESKDPRITPLGRILRRTAIDELPQLFNVLKGEMSLVGPRPEQPRFVEEFQKEIPEYFRRHKVKSGITGWAQVNGLRGDTSIPERVKYDLYYIENWSLWFDIKIILKTFLMILKTGQGNQN